MEIIDLIVLLVFLIALWNGWSKGIIIQLVGLAGLALALWLGFTFGPQAGHLLSLPPDVSHVGGFAAVFVVSFLASAIAARLLRKLFSFAGFSAADRILGILLCSAKYLVALSILFAATDRFNRQYGFIEQQTLDRSYTFYPVMRVSEMLLPLMEQACEHLPEVIIPDGRTA